MANLFIIFFISTSFFFSVFNVEAKELDKSELDGLIIKVSKKFSRTYCNTFKFGISNDGAMEFALGETNKEFSKNKLYQYLNSEDLKNNIISNIENECQVYELPELDLTRLDIDNN